jgi:hypothetical protein
MESGLMGAFFLSPILGIPEFLRGIPASEGKGVFIPTRDEDEATNNEDNKTTTTTTTIAPT